MRNCRTHGIERRRKTRTEQSHLVRGPQSDFGAIRPRAKPSTLLVAAPLIPFDRYIVVGLLDALARPAGNKDLPEDARAVSNELATAILTDTDHNGP